MSRENRVFTKEELEKMTLADAETEVMNAVYGATYLIEQLEYTGKVHGNGHHARQACAAACVKILRDRWKS